MLRIRSPTLCFKLLIKGGLHCCSTDYLPVSGTICFLYIAWIAFKKQDGTEIISGALSAEGRSPIPTHSIINQVSMCVTVIGNIHRASVFHIYQPLIPSTHIRKRTSSGIFLLNRTSLCFLIHRMMILPGQNMYQASRYTDISNCDSETDQPDTIAVYNGDRGIIKFATPQQLVVTFDQWGDVSFKRDCFHNIELGYALSCHKLQGSEANYVIVGFDMSSMILLSKEWLYTAITRAKKHCVICAETRSVSYANHCSNISQKQTMLKELLRLTFGNTINRR